MMIEMEGLAATPKAREKVMTGTVILYRLAPCPGISLREGPWHQHSRLYEPPFGALEGCRHFRVGLSAGQELRDETHSD